MRYWTGYQYVGHVIVESKLTWEKKVSMTEGVTSAATPIVLSTMMVSI